MFPWKSITKILIPIFEVGVSILVIDFQGNIFMSSDGFQNLQNKILFNLRRHSTFYDLPFQSYDQSKNVTVWALRRQAVNRLNYVFLDQIINNDILYIQQNITNSMIRTYVNYTVRS